MKHEKLAQALDEISDNYIQEAAKPRRHRPYWLGAAAAVLALVIALSAVLPKISQEPSGTGPEEMNTPTQNTQATTAPQVLTEPGFHLQYLSAMAEYPKLSPYPQEYEASAYDAWRQEQRTLHDQPEGYADSLEPYFRKIIPALLTNADEQNAACSPVNIYMALAMLAESTGSQSRSQLLALLNADSIEDLRTQAGYVWKGHYNNDGLSTSILANSLWLDNGYSYHEQTAQLLADSYYASTFRGDLGSVQINQALRAWLNEQTGNLLQKQTENLFLAPNSSLALASTIFYQVQWQNKFSEELNTQGYFHGTAGDNEVTFMNRRLLYGPYYWSENFGAVTLSLEDGSKMWLLLPDEGSSPEDILNSGEVMDFLLHDMGGDDSTWENEKRVIVNLSVPKFDIVSSMELSEQLQALGITDIFQAGTADFSPLIASSDGGSVDQIQHSVRVGIDEEGVTAAAFTVIDRAGASMPPEEEIDFVLDRPFVFIVESADSLPLFAGVVNKV